MTASLFLTIVTALFNLAAAGLFYRTIMRQQKHIDDLENDMSEHKRGHR